MVLNMLSTGVMIKLGKVYSNLMVDVVASNEKLVNRAVSIVCSATGESEDVAKSALEKCDYHCKTAVVMILINCDEEKARNLLDSANGRIADAIKEK